MGKNGGVRQAISCIRRPGPAVHRQTRQQHQPKAHQQNFRGTHDFLLSEFQGERKIDRRPSAKHGRSLRAATFSLLRGRRLVGIPTRSELCNQTTDLCWDESRLQTRDLTRVNCSSNAVTLRWPLSGQTSGSALVSGCNHKRSVDSSLLSAGGVTLFVKTARSKQFSPAAS